MKKQNRYIALLIIAFSLITVGSCLTACQANSFSLAVTEKKMMSGTEGSTGAATYTESIEKLKHNYQVTVAEPTYTQSGNNVGKYTACSKTYTDSYKTYEDTSTDSGNNIYDPSLTPPEVARIELSDVDIYCYADFDTNIGYGYECELARDKDFTQGVLNRKRDNEDYDMGFTSFSFYYASGSYYYRLRTYRTEGDICYYGPWSEVGQLSCINNRKKLDKEAQYSYEIYFMDNVGTDVYTDTHKAVYIKTDNPNNYAVALKVNGESILQSIFSYDSMGKRSRYYDDVEYLDITDCDSLLCKVPGGIWVYSI